MKYLITGGSGYIGGRLTELLVARRKTKQVINVDLRPPDVPWPKTTYVRADVRDRAAIQSLLEDNDIDVLIHLAFIFDPIHDEGLMYDVDVNGTHSVLEAAATAGTGQVLVTSSAIAYGAFPDNPDPITEEHPVRGQPDFSYARDKAEADRVCQLWAAQHPKRVMTIVRPSIVFGPNVDNWIVRGWEDPPFMPIIDGVEQELQFVHEDDVVTALVALLDSKASGAFNLAPDDTLPLRESAAMVGMGVREMKMSTIYRIYQWSWRLRLPGVGAPAGSLHGLKNPWRVSNQKLKEETGWVPALNSRQVFEQTMRAKGLRREPVVPVAAAPIGG